MRRNIKQGSNTIFYAILVIAAVIVVNLISQSNHKKFDLTKEGAFTLSEASVKAMKGLSEVVTVYAFIKPEKRDEVKDVLEMYKYESDKFSYQIVDPDKQPGLAKKYNVREYGTFVVQADKDKKEVIPPGKASSALGGGPAITEEALTNAITKAVSQVAAKKVYVVEGHGERSIEDKNAEGWLGVKQVLESSGYKVEALNWFTTGNIPDDADIVMIAGPKQDYTDAEINFLRARLDAGKGLIIALDPAPLPRLEAFLEEYGFKFHKDMILDPYGQQLGFDPLVAIGAAYDKESQIVKDFRLATFFPESRSIELVKQNPKKTDPKMIAQTSKQSWSAMDLSVLDKAGTISYNEGTDMAGPRILVATAEFETGAPKEERKIGEKPKKARLVVAGDSDFAANSSLGMSGNKDLFLNMAGWLSDQDDRISIRPKTKGFNPIMFTKPQLMSVFWTVVVFIPLIMLIAGIVVKVKRRKN